MPTLPKIIQSEEYAECSSTDSASTQITGTVCIIECVFIALLCTQRISNHYNNRISSQEHLRYETILWHWLGLSLSFTSFWDFTPKLTNVFQNHVAVSVKSNHSTQEFLVVSYIDQNLCLLTNALGQDRQRAMFESLLFFSFLLD